MAFRVIHQDWLVAIKYGCKLSFDEFKQLHREQHDNVCVVVSAWCKHFMKRKGDE